MAVSRLSSAPSFQVAQGFVGAGDDLLALVQAGEHLDVGGAGDAGGDGNELGAQLAVLDPCRPQRRPAPGWLCRRDWRRRWRGLHTSVALLDVLGRVVHGERLDGQREHIGLVRGGDLGGAGKAGAQIVGQGASRVTTTLKSLASSVPVVDCEVATPVERSSA